jgi:hypothetical protein
MPFQPLVVFHAHELHEFGAGLHARKRSCVLERLLVVFGIGDGYFAGHVILVDHLKALHHLQLLPMGMLRGVQVSHGVKSLGFDDHRVAFPAAAGNSPPGWFDGRRHGRADGRDDFVRIVGLEHDGQPLGSLNDFDRILGTPGARVAPGQAPRGPIHMAGLVVPLRQAEARKGNRRRRHMLAALRNTATFICGSRQICGAGVVPDAAEIRLTVGQAGNGVIGRLGHGGQACEEQCEREHRELERTGHVLLLFCKSRNVA